MLVMIDITCPLCGKISSIKVDENDYLDYKNDKGLAQDIFWYLNAQERELLISGICGRCWNETFNEPDEEEDSDGYEPDWIDDDFGFDPYAGCYSEDC